MVFEGTEVMEHTGAAPRPVTVALQVTVPVASVTLKTTLLSPMLAHVKEDCEMLTWNAPQPVLPSSITAGEMVVLLH